MDSTHNCICKHGLQLSKKVLGSATVSVIKKSLIFKPDVIPSFVHVSVPEYHLYLENDTYLYVPRFWGVEKLGDPSSVALPNGKKMVGKMVAEFSLLPHQKPIWKAVRKHYGDKVIGGGGIISLPCGYGKTAMAILTAVWLGRRTLVVVHKEFLLDQWVESIKRFTSCTVGRIQGSKFEVGDFTIGMLQTLSGRAFKEGFTHEVFSQFGTVIVDEAHHIGALKFSQSLPLIHTKYMIGLSATPTRADGMSTVIEASIGPVFLSIKRTGNNKLVVKRLICDSKEWKTETRPDARGKEIKDTVKMRGNLCRDKRRTLLLVKLILKVYENEARQLIVFSSLREHLKTIERMLLDVSGDKDLSVGFYWGAGKTSKKQHKKDLENASKCRIVLSTYDMASEGLDIPTLNTLIFASPASEKADATDQAVGRILRRFHKTTRPLVIDVVDKVGNFIRHSESRVRYYRSTDYEVNVSFCHIDNEKEEYLNEVVEEVVNVKPYVPTKTVKKKVIDEDEEDEEEEEEKEDTKKVERKDRWKTKSVF